MQTVDLFAGPVKLDAKGIARVKLTVPDFNGTLRVSALVYSGGTLRQPATRNACVRAPVLAEASLPRVLAPGDRSNVTLDVQNFTGKPGDVQGAGRRHRSAVDRPTAARTVKLAPKARTRR